MGPAKTPAGSQVAPKALDGVAKKQAIEMFTGFVADIGRVLKRGSKIRIPL